MGRLAFLLALRSWVTLGMMAAAAWSAEPSALHQELGVVEHFAPILWFAVDEPVYPTIPHPLAFDGKDNDGNGSVDLEDVWEVQFGFQEASTVEEIAGRFSRLRASPPMRVLYDGPSVFHAERSGKREPSDVLAFWFYYLFDQGVGAHVNDSEHAFVFLDVHDGEAALGDPARYELAVDDEGLSRAVRGVVGAAHETHTANNILVAGRETKADKVLPQALPPHMPILVELGKHASAPDRNLDGRFDKGMDANVFRGSAWGSRDMQTANLGQVNIGPFRSWFSFPRSPRDLYVEESYFKDRGDGEADGRRGGTLPSETDSRRDSYRAYRARLDEALLPKNQYRLFPVDDMRKLYELLEATSTSERKRRSVLDFLEEHKECFWGEGHPGPVTISDDVFPVMEQWPQRPDDKREVWKHRDYRDKENVFKLHLYPRLALGGGGIIETQVKGGWQAAVQFADVYLPTWVPLLGGQRFLNDSSLEVSLGRRAKIAGISDWAITYKKYRGSYGGFFIGTGGRREDLPGAAELSPAQLRQLAIETGRLVDDSIPDIVSKRAPVYKMWWGVDVGLAATYHLPRGVKGRGLFFELKAGGRFEPFKDDLTDIDRAFGARERLRAYVSLTMFVGVVNPKHPLTY